MNTTTTKLKGILTIFSLFFILAGFSQTGKIAGRLTASKRGDNVSGATITIQGSDRKTTSDVEGKFAFSNVPVGTYVLEFSSMGFQKKAVSEIEVKSNDVATLEVLMEEQAKEMDNIVIKATPRRMETVNALLIRQKNLPNISDGISAESIKRSPDKNTSEVLKRVSGATIQENKYVVVRGLSDRYNVATLNNSILPSTEADRKVFAFDIIPSNLVDNIQIFKTATPELPGDFSGGVVQINTQDVPNKNQVSIAAGLTYNTISTGKNFRIGYLGKYDYLGFESGKRRLPSGLPNIRSLPTLDEKIQASKTLNNLFGDRHTGKAWPGQNYQVSWAFKKDFEDKSTLGIILSGTYRNNQNIQNSERYEYSVPSEYASSKLYNYKDSVFKFTTTIGAIANVAYKKNNSKISFKNLFNRLMEVTDINRTGENLDNLTYVRASSNETNIKTLYSSQLEGEHIIGSKQSKINWNANFAFTGGEQPDYRISPYIKSIDQIDDKNAPLFVNLRDSYRFFSELKDFAYGAGGNYTIPFKLKNGEKNTFKTGLSYLRRTREYSARAFRYEAASPQFNDDLLYFEPEIVFAPEYMLTEGFVLNEITANSDKYTGESNTIAGFVMLDNRISKKLRLVWGLRVENFDYIVKTADFSNPNITIKKSYLDWMPSFNLTYNLTDKSNLRFAGWRSVSRPDFREVANFQFYDFSRNAIIQGNSSLERSQNTNLDLRYEVYPNAGEIFSFSLFVKHFDQPIESVVPSSASPSNLFITYSNPKSALSYGAEVEFRKSLSFLNMQFLKDLTLFGNFAYIKSSIDFEGTRISNYDKGRAMQGQSPYIVNAGLQYVADKSGFSTTMLVNRIGQRIAFVGNEAYPDVYENGRTIFDIQIAQKIAKGKGEFKLNIGDILNQKAIFYQNSKDITKRSYNNSDDNVWNTFRYGTNFSLTFSYSF